MMRTLLLAAPLVMSLTVAAIQTPASPPPSPSQSSAATCPEMARALESLMRNDVRLRDWPLLSRYREANRAVPPPSPSEPRVVFMGDSITDMWQQPRFGGFFPGKPYLDRGISGQTTPQMLLRFRQDVMALQPKAVVILAGTNDIAGNTGPMTNEEIQGHLASMSDLARAHDIKVVPASILPTSDHHVAPNATPQTTLRPMARITAINAWIKDYAAANGHVYLDYFSAMTDANGLLRSELSADDLHPNIEGYAVMAPLAEAAVARALK